jgi:hypothetical protein
LPWDPVNQRALASGANRKVTSHGRRSGPMNLPPVSRIVPRFAVVGLTSNDPRGLPLQQHQGLSISLVRSRSLTHSQIVKASIPVGAIAALAFLGNQNETLDAVTHGATHFTGIASHREQQDADRGGRRAPASKRTPRRSSRSQPWGERRLGSGFRIDLRQGKEQAAQSSTTICLQAVRHRAFRIALCR